MREVRISAGVPSGRSHSERLTAANEILSEAIATHGSAILCVGIYGTTAVGLDGPYSDLDMTFVTTIDLGSHSEVTLRGGLVLNLDFQTCDESVAEAKDPDLAGT
jgi:hypothetical protein